MNSGRLILIVSILASFLSGLDQSIVNVALPAITHDLGGGLAAQQWITSAYLITLGSLILVAGSLSDIFGRKRILQLGVLGFGITSALCALAPSIEVLIAARALQGVFGALLVPSSLALIISAFHGKAQSKAIGTWTGWTGISVLIGPFLGGVLVDGLSWRYIFLINIIPTLITLLLMRRLTIDHRQAGVTVDILGAVLCTIGLAGTVFGLIEQPEFGWVNPLIYGSFGLGILFLAAFLWHERATKDPMMPLSLFAVRNFSVGNIATIAIYAGLSVSTFLVTIFIQQVGGYSAILAGLSFLPTTVIMFFLSSRFGALAGRFGPRFFMAIGPLVAAFGFLWLLRTSLPIHYWIDVFPSVLIFGLGLSMAVAPLTSAVLADIRASHAGIGSAINNAIARIAGLVSIASIGIITGESMSLESFKSGVILMAALLVAGGIVSAIGIKNPTRE